MKIFATKNLMGNNNDPLFIIMSLLMGIFHFIVYLHKLVIYECFREDQIFRDENISPCIIDFPILHSVLRKTLFGAMWLRWILSQTNIIKIHFLKSHKITYPITLKWLKSIIQLQARTYKKYCDNNASSLFWGIFKENGIFFWKRLLI